MAKPKLTPWFHSSVKPVRAGYYERDWSVFEYRGNPVDYWNGVHWVLVSDRGNHGSRSHLKLAWRGLAEQPKEQKK